MSKIVWDQTGERLAETGADQGVLYPYISGVLQKGIAWNGLTSVNEAPTGAEANPFYADNRKYLEIMSEEEFAGSIGCYTYPDEFKPCIGEGALAPGIIIGQQSHTMFGFSYRTKIVNDVDGVDHGYKIHLVYNALAGVSARDHTTMNETPELEEITFDFTTTKVDVTDGKPTAHLIVDSTKITSQENLTAFLNILYGAVGVEPRLPMPDELANLFTGADVDAISFEIEPDDEDTDVAVNASVVITFNNKLANEAVTIISSSGIVEAAHSFDITGKILTLKPKVNLDTSTVYTVIIAGVVDIYGSVLTTESTAFTTAA